MWGFLSTVLYRYSATQATKEGFLTPLKVHVHEIEGIRGSTYPTEYTKNYCQNEALLDSVLSIIKREISKDEQLLILVGRKEKSGNIIHEFLKELGIHSEYVSGDSKRESVRSALQNFNSKKTRILIGSSIIGEGIDVRSTDHLIMAQGGKSEIAVTQAIGRAVRLYPGKKIAHIHDFKFSYTKYLEKHLNKRLDIYKKNFGGEVEC
jgi:superfamily II DNA or RNA helicase